MYATYLLDTDAMAHSYHTSTLYSRYNILLIRDFLQKKWCTHTRARTQTFALTLAYIYVCVCVHLYTLPVRPTLYFWTHGQTGRV